MSRKPNPNQSPSRKSPHHLPRKMRGQSTRPAGSAPAATAVVADSETTYVTPLVRKLAKEHGVDLETLNGTGVGGRIRKQDVLAAAEAAKQAAAAPAPEAPAEPAAAAPAAPAAAAPEVSTLRGTTEKMSRLRQTIAKRMVESLQVSAQLTATVEVDMTAISQIRAKVKDDFKQREGATLSYLPFIAKASVEALKAYPKVNATIDTEERTITYPDAEHLGIAVDTEKGSAGSGDQGCGRPEYCRTGQADRRPGGADATEQGDTRRAHRWHVHDHQLRLRGDLDGHPDHQPASSSHPGNRCARQATGRDLRSPPGAGDRGPRHDVPVTLL